MTHSKEVPSEPGFLSTEAAGPGLKKTILIVLLISLVGFLAGFPFAHVQLPEAPTFIAGYGGLRSSIDVITAVLLFGQFMQLRSRSLLILAAGYIFDAAMVVLQALTFPGAFSPPGLLDAGPQTAAWLYILWHFGFPLFILGYALAARSGNDRATIKPDLAILAACVGPMALAAGFTMLTTLAHDRLPAIITDGFYSPGLLGFPALMLLGPPLAALVVLWARRVPTVLDLGLMSVLAAWLPEVVFAGRPGMHRYDFGWYAGRVYGLLAGSFLLVMLLFEAQRLYANLSETLKLAEARNADLLRSRADFARVQRMDAMGKVVAGVAHDFNNILTVITGSLETARFERNQTAKLQHLIQLGLQAARRGADITRQLLTFARGQARPPEILDANNAINGVEGFIKRAAGDAVRVTLNLKPDLWPVLIDQAEFETALLNLVVNARDAVGATGEIRIETRNVGLADGDLVEGLEAGDYAVISIADNGPGFSPEIAAHAFEPFFTTKDVGKGSGLGLSQVYGFARGAGGAARIAPNPGGARIEIYLPRCVARPGDTPELSASAANDVATGRAKVLLVEDDEDVRASTAGLIASLGFDVVTAEGPKEALSILDRDPAIGILFSDFAMPGGMNGAQLAMEARRRHPELEVILASGYPASVLAEKYDLPEKVPVLSKPFMPDDLLKAIRRLAGT